ncbi:phosphate signaling complex protein PhoU [Natronorarus salvus]|uniref:phosphate signaling complex protein PhoU n=1 Tax=Natronorarus salvus TaxID=3117733 RepID=UPI002F2659BE
MARKEYQKRLSELRDDVLYMGEVVQERLRMALSALESKDDDLAEEVIVRDSEVNDLYLELERQCTELIARQQPVAGDLRFIAASFKIITDLERIADLATNLGKYTKQARRDVYPDVDVQAIGAVALEMIEAAMDAYADEDVEACYAIDRRDDELDAMCERASGTVVRDLIETELGAGTDEGEIERLLSDVSRVLLTVRDLERIGDHAVNIAARTLYMVENDDELLY